jgi:hypothetical protein
MVSELIITDAKDSLRMVETSQPDLVLVLNGLIITVGQAMNGPLICIFRLMISHFNPSRHSPRQMEQ